MRRARPPKTKKSVAKRFRITATGKVMRSRAGRRHLLQSKGPGRRRSLRKAVEVGPTDAHRVLASLPFTR